MGDYRLMVTFNGGEKRILSLPSLTGYAKNVRETDEVYAVWHDILRVT